MIHFGAQAIQLHKRYWAEKSTSVLKRVAPLYLQTVAKTYSLQRGTKPILVLAQGTGELEATRGPGQRVYHILIGYNRLIPNVGPTNQPQAGKQNGKHQQHKNSQPTSPEEIKFLYRFSRESGEEKGRGKKRKKEKYRKSKKKKEGEREKQRKKEKAKERKRKRLEERETKEKKERKERKKKTEKRGKKDRERRRGREGKRKKEKERERKRKKEKV